MLTRRVARPLLASWFVVEGLDALRHTDEHTERLKAAWRRVGARVEALPDVPPDDTLRTLTRAFGAGTALAGLMLATNRAPRLASTALALLTIPVAVIDAPTRDRTSRAGTARTGAGTTRDDHAFVRDLSLIGGAVLAGLDREGNPSIGWRVRNARERAATA